MKIIPHSRPTLSQKEATELKKAILTGQLAQGPKVILFEKKFLAFQKTKYASAVNSGTSALHLTLLALGVGLNDEVIIPSFVCTALLNAIYYVQAVPRVIDVDPLTFSLSLKDTKKNITNRTKAIILPHMFGHPIDVKPFVKLGVPVIEDCAQSIGASFNNNIVGNDGVAAIFSFFATKMMTTGEGGMVTSRNNKLIDFIKDRRDYDNRPDYGLRFNYKMSDINAAIGIIQLAKLPEMISQRKKIALEYSRRLQDIDIGLPPQPQSGGSVYFRYIIKTPNAGKLISSLQKQGVNACRPVFKPLHTYLLQSPVMFPQTMSLMKEAVSLPIYPTLSKPDQDRVIHLIRKSL